MGIHHYNATRRLTMDYKSKFRIKRKIDWNGSIRLTLFLLYIVLLLGVQLHQSRGHKDQSTLYPQCENKNP